MKYHQLPLETGIEVIARKGGVVKKKIMSYGEAIRLKAKVSNWSYDFFQLGFSAFKLT